jgi:ribonuclease P protein component
VKGTLRSRAQFRRVYDHGEKRVGKYVVLFVLAPEIEGRTQVGVVASRKVGDAVRRNRAKRVLRSAYREVLPMMTKSCELILVARRSVVDPEVRSDMVQAELRAHLKGLGYLSLNPEGNGGSRT